MSKREFIIKKQSIEEKLFSEFAESKQIKRFGFTPLESPYDVKMQSGDTYCICETKVRQDYDLFFFNKYGPYLEYKKIEGMYNEKKRLATLGFYVQMMYFNFSADGLQIYYLSEPWNYEFKWKKLPKDNYEPNILIWKLVAELKNPQEILINK